MKTSKFTDTQIAFVLRQAEEGTGVVGFPEGRYFAADILSLEEALWQADAV